MRLLDERSTAFRPTVAATPSLDAQVPTCPEWTLFALARHLGEGRHARAATIAAGPDAGSTRSAHEPVLALYGHPAPQTTRACHTRRTRATDPFPSPRPAPDGAA
ncbi:maleylpyruvate isomerase N-terminal domain-containing protein [Streptomyces sp. NPDC048106]|uniref:maleylpyruvate isomerase N-terminal domain-containing protein n=1 Tax=Streptomyces sp. NPDC048106 TaxID=3155750 RepID=UPI0034547016